MRSHWVLAAGVAALGLSFGLAPASHAAESHPAESKDLASRPERGISVYTEYSRLTVPLDEKVRMDLTVEDKGRRDENVLVTLASVPHGWKASIKGGQFDVSGVPVDSGKSRVLSFTAEPDKGLRPGSYTFQIDGATADHALAVTQTVVVTTEPRKTVAGGALQVSTSYPVLRGPTDSSFEFSLDVNNKSDVDRVVNLAADAPKDWDVNIKPAYESKQITSLRIKAGSSQTVAIDLKAPAGAQAGTYPVVFHASTEGGQADARLQVVLTGTYRLDAVTPTGRLSLDAVVGKPATTTLIVKNDGTAVNHGVKLSAIAPENWKVEFSPKTIESIEPGDFKQVEATITPAAQALVGDYSVSLTADGEKASSKTMELRVTAHAPNTWAWIGLGMMAAVIGGLGGLFTWLGRR